MYSVLKRMFNHIASIYLIAFVLMSSIAIPYSAVTCNVSNESSWSVLISDSHCNDGCTENKNSSTSFDKPACCLFDFGLIDIDTELVQHDVKTFVSIIPVSVVRSLALAPVSAKIQIKRTSFVQAIPRVPLRILQQSFLC